jgi:hypothetical protein
MHRGAAGNSPRSGSEGLYTGAGPRGGRRQQIKTFATTTGALLELRQCGQQVTVVGIENTGDYWKPMYLVVEDPVDVQLLNAAHMHNVPGRRTDVADSAWIAPRGARPGAGELRASAAAWRGKRRALVAVGHSILIAAWPIISDGVTYHELGPLHFLTRINPARQTRRLVTQLQQLGYRVELNPIASG